MILIRNLVKNLIQNLIRSLNQIKINKIISKLFFNSPIYNLNRNVFGSQNLWQKNNQIKVYLITFLQIALLHTIII